MRGSPFWLSIIDTVKTTGVPTILFGVRTTNLTNPQETIGH